MILVAKFHENLTLPGGADSDLEAGSQQTPRHQLSIIYVL